MERLQPSDGIVEPRCKHAVKIECHFQVDFLESWIEEQERPVVVVGCIRQAEELGGLD